MRDASEAELLKFLEKKLNALIYDADNVDADMREFMDIIKNRQQLCPLMDLMDEAYETLTTFRQDLVDALRELQDQQKNC